MQEEIQKAKLTEEMEGGNSKGRAKWWQASSFC